MHQARLGCCHVSPSFRRFARSQYLCQADNLSLVARCVSSHLLTTVARTADYDPPLIHDIASDKSELYPLDASTPEMVALLKEVTAAVVAHNKTLGALGSGVAGQQPTQVGPANGSTACCRSYGVHDVMIDTCTTCTYVVGSAR